MRSFWDDAAVRNAMFYVDTTLSYDDPDPEAFIAGGRRIAAIALDDTKAVPPGRGLAIEIGSGLGRICAALAESFDHVVGYDISAEMVKQARKLVDRPNVEFRHGDGVSLAGVDDDAADF